VAEIFSTRFVVLFGACFVFAYMIILSFQKRSKDITLPDIGGVFFASASIIGGFKLMYTTIVLLNAHIIETDKVYTIYGGFCVIYISLRTLYSKVKL
jgi:hypothetical protein